MTGVVGANMTLGAAFGNNVCGRFGKDFRSHLRKDFTKNLIAHRMMICDKFCPQATKNAPFTRKTPRNLRCAGRKVNCLSENLQGPVT